MGQDFPRGILALLADEGAGLAAIFAGARIVVEVVFIHPNHLALAMRPRLGLRRVAARPHRLGWLLAAGLWFFPRFRGAFGLCSRWRFLVRLRHRGGSGQHQNTSNSEQP